MTTNSTSEREQRLKEIRERQARCTRPDRDDVPQRSADPLARALSKELRQAQIDRGFLLSLIDSEAAGEEPEVAEQSCCISALLHSRQKAAQKRKLEQRQK